MNNVIVLGIDLAKDVFQLHAINEHGKKIFNKKVSCYGGATRNTNATPLSRKPSS